MGGIAGLVYRNVFQVTDLISPMLHTMVRHGATVRDVHIFKNFQICIGEKKLFSSPKKNIIVALDGVISNVENLRQQLKNQGYKITTDSHAEIIVHAYDHWGSDFLPYLQGDFAIAVLDKEQEKLLIARDRIGRRNLYWYLSQDQFMFASEIKALLASGIIPATPAKDALSAYLYFGYIPQDMSPIQGINKLLPGYYLEFDSNYQTRINPYWSIDVSLQQKFDDIPKNAISQFEELFYNSVSKCIPKTRPIGSFLSGGLGSAATTFFLKKVVPSNELDTFSVDFQGENTEDLEAARSVAKQLELPHFSDTITPAQFLENLVAITWYLDEPLADPNVVATWHLAKLASSHTQVVFSGMASDEFLAGHTRYIPRKKPETFLERLFLLSAPLIKSFLIPIVKRISETATFYILQKTHVNPWQLDYFNANALFTRELQKKAAPILVDQFNPEIYLHKFYYDERKGPSISSFLYFDIKTRLVDCYIQQYQRITAAHQLQWKTPFIDLSVLEYLARMPDPEAFAEKDTASFLKIILKDHLSNEFINRPKINRRDFLKRWVEQCDLGNLFPLLASGKLAEAGLISAKWLKESTSTPHLRTENFRYLWAILSLEIWFRLFVNRTIGSKPPEISLRELLLEP